jgi:flagellar basal-body rod protein FlgB
MFRLKLPLLNKSLDAYAMRQKTIAKNLANISSPHYRPENVKFEELFSGNETVATGVRTDERHIPIGEKSASEVDPEVQNAPVPQPEVYFSGETHVNIDKEMSAMAENQIRFRFASTMVKNYFSGLQSSIKGISQ